jgi:tetratricopeptide (TPR) repeat protein
MKNDLAHKAVCAALKGDWKTALNVNTEIIKKNKKDVDALNRLARAYAEIGETPKARKSSKKVLDIDPLNKIALRSLIRWKDLKKGESIRTGNSSNNDCNDYIEEPGKTKIVALIHVGSPKLIACMACGDEVRLNPHGHRVSVISIGGKYIGRLPDDIGAKLRTLMKMGNEYKVLIKSSEGNNMSVFIRETKSSPELSNIPSFTHERIDYISFNTSR